MPYANIVFAKLEKRILNDPRWFMLGESAQLNYIRLILAACETYNRIPRNPAALKKMFRTELTEEQIRFLNYERMGNFTSSKISMRKPITSPRKSKGNPKEIQRMVQKKKKKRKRRRTRLKAKNRLQPLFLKIEKIPRPMICSSLNTKRCAGWNISRNGARTINY